MIRAYAKGAGGNLPELKLKNIRVNQAAGWTKIDEAPTALNNGIITTSNSRSIQYGDSIYCQYQIGTHAVVFLKYDIENNTITELSSPPLYYIGTARFYVFGGMYAMNGKVYGFGIYGSTLYMGIYDIDSDTWNNGDNFLKAIPRTGSMVHPLGWAGFEGDRYMYGFGGGTSHTNNRYLWKLDLETFTISYTPSSFGSSSSFIHVLADPVRRVILFVGCYSVDSGSTYGEALQYDPKEDRLISFGTTGSPIGGGYSRYSPPVLLPDGSFILFENYSTPMWIRRMDNFRRNTKIEFLHGSLSDIYYAFSPYWNRFTNSIELITNMSTNDLVNTPCSKFRFVVPQKSQYIQVPFNGICKFDKNVAIGADIQGATAGEIPANTEYEVSAMTILTFINDDTNGTIKMKSLDDVEINSTTGY